MEMCITAVDFLLAVTIPVRDTYSSKFHSPTIIFLNITLVPSMSFIYPGLLLENFASNQKSYNIVYPCDGTFKRFYKIFIQRIFNKCFINFRELSVLACTGTY